MVGPVEQLVKNSGYVGTAHIQQLFDVKHPDTVGRWAKLGCPHIRIGHRFKWNRWTGRLRGCLPSTASAGKMRGSVDPTCTYGRGQHKKAFLGSQDQVWLAIELKPCAAAK